MGATSTNASQWLFPLSAFIRSTPSRTTSSIPLEKELYDRARGVEFLFRLGVSLGLPSSAMFTAATWFHRFYMRNSMEDYHRQDVAATCIFLATKTEECGRKLRDVAKITCSKISRIKVDEIPDDSKDVEECQNVILHTEEALLEALCFDFTVNSPHADLVDLFEAKEAPPEVEEYAWTVASDSYRTPLCILYPPRIIAAAAYVLAQQYAEGPNALSLAARIASPAPSASLPTPPSHKSITPESARFALDFYKFNEVELSCVAEALTIMIEFYSAQDVQGSVDYLAAVAAITPPNITSLTWEKLYLPLTHVTQNIHNIHNQPEANHDNTSEAQSSQGITGPPLPLGSASGGWVPVQKEGPSTDNNSR